MTSSPIVLITGASGFVGSAIVLEALKQGFTPRLALRKASQADAWKTKYPEHAQKLHFAIVEDFLAPGAFDEPLKGASHVVHAASPVNFAPKDNRADVLDPAVNNVLGLLQSAKAAGSVKSISLTSSIVAHFNISKPPVKVTDQDFADFTYEEAAKYGPESAMLTYSASKVLAEKAAWDFMKKEQPSFTFTALSPAYVLGHNAQLDLSWSNATGASTWDWATQLLDSNGLPPAQPGAFVNVLDVAKAHMSALTNPVAAGKRYLLVAGPLTYDDTVAKVSKLYPEQAGRWAKFGDGETVKGVQKGPVFEAGAAEKDLGFKYIDADKTVESYAKQLFALPGAVSAA